MGSKGLGGHARIGGGGGAGGMDPIGKSHVIWVDLDLKTPPASGEISWFRAWGDLFHWNALEQIA